MLIPSKDTVILKDIPVEEVGGIVIPGYQGDKDKPELGRVVAVGSGEQPFENEKIEPGDIVYYERYLDNRINFRGEKFNFIRFTKIVALEKNEKNSNR